jgi:hypothetical protein
MPKKITMPIAAIYLRYRRYVGLLSYGSMRMMIPRRPLSQMTKNISGSLVLVRKKNPSAIRSHTPMMAAVYQFLFFDIQPVV